MIAPLATPLVRSLALPLFRQGGGGDFLSLDLAFALDRSFTTDPTDAGKALITSRRGPAAKFSRGSGATQVNAAGLIEYAPENLMTRSEEFDNSIWDAATQRNLTVTANDTASPSGAIDADRLTVGSGSTVYQVIQNIPSPSGTLTSGTTYTVSAFFKPNQVTRVSIWAGNAATLPVDAMFDLTGSGSVVANAFGTASIQQYPNGWYRCVITGTAAATSSTSLRISPVSGTSRTYPGNSVDSFYAWGAQLERASTARTYYPTTTAAFYGPRFDHDPATGASKGLLIEEPRTNLLARSSEFNTSPWAVNNSLTVSPDAVIAPDGTLTADALIFDNNSTSRCIYLAGSAAVHTFSVWLRADSAKTCVIATAAADVFIIEVVANLTTVWQRFTVVASNWASGTGSFNVRIANNSTGTSGTIYAWGAQLEAGAFPTSYIPTTSGTAARSADVCSIVGDAFASFYNQSEGTVSKQVYAANGLGSTTQFPFGFSDGTTANQLSIFRATDDPRKFGFFSNTNNVGTPTSPIRTATINDREYGALAWAFKQNDMAGVFKGQLYTDTTITIPSVNQLHIGNRFDGARPWNGHIARIQYFRKRLANAKLQTLTTP